MRLKIDYQHTAQPLFATLDCAYSHRDEMGRGLKPLRFETILEHR